jgi:hypothetical protein
MKIAIVGATMLCLPGLAHASGQLLPLSPSTVTFRSHSACLAALEDAYTKDRRQVVPRNLEANGDTREVGLDTKGIEKIGRKTARYEATIWYANGRYRPDLQQTETSHSYRHEIRQCHGKTMKTTGDQGYTLSTFDPADPPASPK